MYPDKFVSKPQDIPVEEHFAVFEEATYHTEGYDRNDPGTTTSFVQYRAYMTKDKLLEAIRQNEAVSYGKKSYRVCKIIPMKIEISIDVAVK
jgi:hypothetical protein